MFMCTCRMNVFYNGTRDFAPHYLLPLGVEGQDYITYLNGCFWLFAQQFWEVRRGPTTDTMSVYEYRLNDDDTYGSWRNTTLPAIELI